MVYWLGVVVQQDNRSTVWIEEADEWCSLSRTKGPPLYFIDVLMQLSWLSTEFVQLTVWADRCTWMLNAKRGFYAFFIVYTHLTPTTCLAVFLLFYFICYSNSVACNIKTIFGGQAFEKRLRKPPLKYDNRK